MRRPLAYAPNLWAGGGFLLFAIFIDALAAHREQITLSQWLERTGPIHGQGLAAIASVVVLWPRFARAWRSMAALRPGTDAVVILAAAVAAAYGYWFISAGFAFVTLLVLPPRELPANRDSR